MASLAKFLFFVSFTILTSTSVAQTSHSPNALLFPITKDTVTLQYMTEIHMGTPLNRIKLLVDLNGPFLWIDPLTPSSSSSYRTINCRSIDCSRAQANHCGTTDTCVLFPKNPITQTASQGDLAEDIFAFHSSDGSMISTAHQLLFTTSPAFLSKGLANGAKGVFGLGMTRIAPPSQIAASLGLQRKFSICLSSSEGIILTGDCSGNMCKSLTYTPLVTDRGDYFISMKSMKIDGRKLSFTMPPKDVRIKFSTVIPHTTMESSIYETFISAYLKAATRINMTTVASMPPFSMCFSAKSVGRTPIGPAVPPVDLLLQTEMVKWRIQGRNLMVRVTDEIMCLGIINGGLDAKDSIVLGGYQLEDNLLQFDLGTSMLGFSSSSTTKQTSCSNLKMSFTGTEELL